MYINTIMTILKLSAIFALILALMAGAFYWYFTYSQNKIGTLEQTTAKLTEAIQIQTQALNDQVAFQKQQNIDLADLQRQLQDATIAKSQLESNFLNSDLNALARKNAKALEDQINKATNQALRDIEKLTAVPVPAPAK